MTTITVTTLVCNMPHDTETEATTTRRITAYGQAYSLDLCDLCTIGVDAALTALLKHAEPVGKPKGKGTTPRTQAMRQEDAQIRAWWKANPTAVNRPYRDKGRLGSDVTDAYRNRRRAA